MIAGVPAEFVIFAVTLSGIALVHDRTLEIALLGLLAVVIFKLLGPGFKDGTGLGGLAAHVAHEAATLSNLFLLLTGFAIVARLFEDSQVPELMPAVLPDTWTGGLALLAMVFVLSAFLDNIAAALIGGTVARHVYKGRVHLGYLAGIVAASNAGGSGSVIGDTTTTMMWIAGVSPAVVFRAYTGASAAFLIFAIPAALQQHRYQPIQKDPKPGIRLVAPPLLGVAAILCAAVAVNVAGNAWAPDVMQATPAIGLAVWAAILATAAFAKPNWSVARMALPGTIFLLALVLTASLMPIDRLPAPAWQTAFGLGLLSSVFDNIPLTALALRQGDYDWGFLAFTVGFGGSMLWFGSSAGVALSNMYPESRSALGWLKAGWHVALAYGAGCLAMLALLGWRA